MSADTRTTILYAENSFTFGGAINSLERLIGALDRSRFEAVVLSAQDQSFLERRFEGVPAHHWELTLPWVEGGLYHRVRTWPGFRRGPLRFALDKARALWWLLAHDLPDSVRFARLARDHGVGIVHLNNGVTGMLPALLGGKLLGLPVVAHARSEQSTGGLHRLHNRLPDRWIAVSQSIAENLEAAGASPDRITVIHNAVDLAAFSEGPPPPSLGGELGLPVGAPVFGIFGRIIPWKGIREFILAAEKVIVDVPGAYGLIVGDRSDGAEEYYEDVVELSRELGIADQIVFTGFRKDVPDIMKLCDVVVHASIAPEPFGLTVIEGMATGKPVVAADSGGPVEVIEPGETGMLVDPADAEALGGAIAGLLKDPHLSTTMGRRAAARARDYYAPERYAREVEEVYEQVLQGRRAR